MSGAHFSELVSSLSYGLCYSGWVSGLEGYEKILAPNVKQSKNKF